jgi:tetratricopeptide (TPR) repeat protein
VDDKLMESRAYSNLADLHSMNGEYSESASYYTKTIALCSELEGTFEKAKDDTEGLEEEDVTALVAECDSKVAMCKETQGKAYADLAAVHHELEQSEEAMSDMTHAIRLAEEVNDKQAEGERLTQLAALKMYGTAEVDNVECQGLLEKSIGVWRQYAVALRQQLLLDLENEEIENPDLANTRAAQFFEEHASTYASLQKVLVAQGKDQEALVVAEEGRTQALYDLLQLTGDAAPTEADCSPMTVEEMQTLAKDNDTTLVVYSMVEADRTLYAWVVNANGDVLFHNINIEEALESEDTSLSQAVRQLYETMAGAARSSLCRGPRDNREEEEEVAAPTPDAEIKAESINVLAAGGIHLHRSVTTAASTSVFTSGSGIFTVDASKTLSTSDQLLRVTVDDLDLRGPTSWSSGTNSITVNCHTAGRTVGLGLASGGLNFTATDFARIHAEGMTIGGSSAEHGGFDERCGRQYVQGVVGTGTVTGVVTLFANRDNANIWFYGNSSTFTALSVKADNGVIVATDVSTCVGALYLDGDHEDSSSGDTTNTGVHWSVQVKDGITLTAKTVFTLEATGAIVNEGTVTLRAGSGVVIHDNLLSSISGQHVFQRVSTAKRFLPTNKMKQKMQEAKPEMN